MAWLTRFVAAFVVAALCVATITVLIDSTILKPAYLEKQATHSNTYNKLSDALTTELVKNTSGQNDPQIATVAHQIITPTLVRQKLNNALEQFGAYYKGSGPAPTIDFTAQVSQAKALGLVVPDDSGINKPIMFNGDNTKTKAVHQKFEEVKLVSILVAVVGLLAVVALSWERHRYAVLPDIAIIWGIIMGLLGGVFSFLPSIVDKYAKINFNANAFMPIVHLLVTNIFHDIGRMFLIIAATLLVVGIITRILVSRTKKPQKPQPKKVPARAMR